MQQDNATQTGAESLSPAHAGRNAALAQIAKAVDNGYQDDLQSFDESTGEIVPKTVEPPKDAPEPEEHGQHVEQGEQQNTVADDELETIVVQGQQIQVKKSQLLDAGRRTLQKETAAAKRLEEATEILRSAQAYAQSLRQPSPDAGNQQSPSEQDATNGNGLSQRQQATPDIGTLVDERLWLHEATKAAQRFRTEFKDIAEDPLLLRLATQLEDERLRKAATEGMPPGDPWEAYRAHGETIRARFGKPQTAAQPVVSEDRTERKRSTTTVVGASVRTPPSQPQKPLTTSEIIEQQRQARMRGRQPQPSR